MANPLIFRYFGIFRITLVAALLTAVAVSPLRAAEPPPYAEHFNPSNGFKPAQPNLTKIFLQMAGSLEHFGSPEPYLRHVLAEHARIDAKFKKATGKGGSSRPAYLTDEYVERLLTGWNQVAAPLKFDGLSREAGRDMRHAIMGSWNMPADELVAAERKLTEAEASTYRKLVAKPWFKKEDFPSMDAFYKTAFDKLTETGKEQISKRTKLGTLSAEKRAEAIENDKGGTILITVLRKHQERLESYLNTDSKEAVNSDQLQAALVSALKLDDAKVDVSGLPDLQRDAILYAWLIKIEFLNRFATVDASAKSPEQAANVRKAMTLMAENLLTVAHSEFMAAIREQLAK